MKKWGENRFLFFIVVCLLLSENSMAFDKLIIFNCEVTFNGNPISFNDTLQVESSMFEISGSATDFNDSIFLELTGDSSIHMMEHSHSLLFLYSNFNDSCYSSMIDIGIDSSRSNFNELYINYFNIRGRDFYYLPYEVCKNTESIAPFTSLSAAEVKVTASNGVVLDNNWNISVSETPPGIYTFEFSSYTCLRSNKDTLTIMDYLPNQEELPDSVRYCKNAITLLEDYPDYEISSNKYGSNIDIEAGKLLKPGVYYLKKQIDSCASIDSIYLEIIDDPSVTLFAEESCSEIALSFETTAQNYSVMWWNNSTDEVTSTAKSERIWVEITGENNCVTRESLDVALDVLSIESLEYITKDADCWEDGQITISDIQTNEQISVNTYYTYTLINNLNGSRTTDFSNVPEGVYTFQLSYSENCLAEYDNEIVVIQNCLNEYPVFTPDNDGIEDEYFIPHEGNIKIYDRNGTLLRIIETPAYWDGRDDAGNLLPMGNYVMLTNTNRAVNITIIR